MFYIVAYLTKSDLIANVRGAAYIQSLMALGCMIIALFSIVLMLYANNFVMKCRLQRTWSLSCAGHGKTAHSPSAFLGNVSVRSGSHCRRAYRRHSLFQTGALLLLRLTNLPVQFGFDISPGAIGQTIVLFGFLFLLTLLSNLVRLAAQSPLNFCTATTLVKKSPAPNGSWQHSVWCLSWAAIGFP